MKSMILYGIAVAVMAQSVVAEEASVQTVVIAANNEKPLLLFSTNITTKCVVGSAGAADANVKVQVFHVKGEKLASSTGAEQKSTWLGVTAEELDEVVRSQLSLASGAGLTIHGVVPDSPAAKAGLMKNDILLRLNDQLLMEPRQLSKLIRSKKPGEHVTLTYLRKGKELQSDVTLGEHAVSVDGGVQVLDLGDMGGALNINVAELLKGVKLSDTNLNSMIEAAVKAVEKQKTETTPP